MALPVAGAALGASIASSWRVSLALEWSAAAVALVALALWLWRRRGALPASIAAALAAAAAAGDVRRSCAAVVRVFPEAPADMSHAALLTGIALGAAALVVALALRRRAGMLGAVALALAVASAVVPAARRTQVARGIVPR